MHYIRFSEFQDRKVILQISEADLFHCSREIKTKTHQGRWVLSCAKGTMFLYLRVLAIPFDIVNNVTYRVISYIYRVISCDIVNIVSIV